MALLEFDLVVKTSLIPGAGMGLFTKLAIPKGTYIVEYKGRRTTWDEIKHEADNMYICYIDDAFVIDGRYQPGASARYANDANGIVRIKGITNNAQYVNDDMKVYIEATKDIAAGAEIFVKYGKEYWDTIKTNRKLQEKEQKEKAAKKKTKK